MAKNLQRIVHLGLVAGLIIGSTSLARPPAVHTAPVEYAFRELSADIATGYVHLEFTFVPAAPGFERCGELQVTISSPDGIKYVGEPRLLISFENTNEVKGDLKLYLPPRDTSELDFLWECTRSGATGTFRYYFVNTADSIEYCAGDPRHSGLGVRRSKESQMDVDPDTLKQVDLDAEYEVFIRAKNGAELSKVEDILGRKLAVDSTGGIRLKLPLRTLIELVTKDVKFQYTTPPPWWNQGEGHTPGNRNNDSARVRGSLDSTDRMVYPGISL